MRALLVALLLMTVALAGCAGEASRDSDGDGLNDREEKAGWFIFVDLVGARIQRHVVSDPDLADSDGDGIADQNEFFLPSDPSNADTDGDGLTDCQEAMHTVLEECEDPDFNGPFDGGYGTSANNADSDRGPSRFVAAQPYDDQTGSIGTTISWGDGISDGDEVHGYEITLPDGSTRIVTTSPTSTDSDGDTLEDGEEALYGGDPTNPDTDGDGCIDGKDAFPDRDESYRLGLDRLRLVTGNDVGGAAQVWFQINFAGEDIRRAPDGSRGMLPGDEWDLSGIETSAREIPCDDNPRRTILTPWAPWMLIQVIVMDQDGNAADVLDSTSRTQANQDGDVWWNVRTGQFSYDLDGATFSGPVNLRGSNAELWFSPTAS